MLDGTDSDIKIRLDLGSGQVPREGFDGVDMFADVKHRVNLLSFPWPWPDDFADELHSSHFIEHIPMVYVSEGDSCLIPVTKHYRDLLCAFFDECWRVLKPGGLMTLVWPALQSVRAFQDPTHRRFIPTETLLYLDKGWRIANGLDHYLASCDFECVESGASVHEILQKNGQLMSQEAVAQAVMRNWNLVTDYKALLKARKETP